MTTLYSNLVDPFIGTEPYSVESSGTLSATWWLPKPAIGNTHPGACYPFGMVSASPYSGAYPTGYGKYQRGTEGVPPALHETLQATGFTHFHQSGTGAIRKYYNYFRVSPVVGEFGGESEPFALADEEARPGYYAATLGETAIRAELSVGPKVASHRYTFVAGQRVSLLIDFSCGGLCIERARTIPTRADLELLGRGKAHGTVVVEGVALSAFLQITWPGSAQALWYGDQLVGGGTRLVFDHIRETTLQPFGIVFSGVAPADGIVELTLGFSLRGVERAQENAAWGSTGGFHEVRNRTAKEWEKHLSAVKVQGGNEQQQETFYTALYHSLIKPCFAADESPFWRHSGPFVFDICTMWDIYKTQLPLITVLQPKRASELLECLIRISEEEGNFPIGYRMARGADRFFRQASALAHTCLADAQALGLTGIDWEWALLHMHNDLSRTYGEEFLEKGRVHPATHTLDLAYGCYCTAKVASGIGDNQLAQRLNVHAADWVNAFDTDTGLLVDSTYYEGTKHNYSYRLLHDMAKRIELSGGDAAFIKQLDEFFGFGAVPVEQLGLPPFGDAVEKGYALGRFEGLNNEPDMEAPFAYHYAGRPDRTAQVVREILDHQFGTGRGGLPGNDDSGGLSSWFIWAALGLFPVAGQNIYLITPPLFEQAQLSVWHGKFEISCRNKTATPQYIGAATLNGNTLLRSYLTGNELVAGGRLELHLQSEPSTWGTEHRPPSVGQST